MEIYQLRTFVTVALEGHVTHAAEKLHISQPAVSAQIKAIENELGLALFERRGSGVVLSKIGESLLPYAEKVLAASADFVAKAQASREQPSGTIRLGVILDPKFLRLGELMRLMVERYPFVQMEIRQKTSPAVLNSIRSGELDASFYLGNAPSAPISNILLRRLTYRVVAPPSWKNKIVSASWEAIAQLPWIRAPKGGAFDRMFGQMFGEQCAEPMKIIEADHESAIVSLVTSGVGISLMRQELADEAASQGRVLIWSAGEAQSSLLFIFHSRREQDKTILAIRKVLEEIWIGDGPPR